MGNLRVRQCNELLARSLCRVAPLRRSEVATTPGIDLIVMSADENQEKGFS